MKVSLIILMVGLAVVSSSPRKPESRIVSQPCSGTAGGVVDCTCGDGTVVTPGGQSCFQLGSTFASCNCADDSTWEA